jgi:pimeloyl-ACP methyl ester carboxylesterase
LEKRVNERIFKIPLTLLMAAIMSSCATVPLPEMATDHEVGQMARVEDVYGTFYAYIPKTAPPEPDILVLVHGTPAKDEAAEATANYYLVSWLDFAEEQGFVLIAPTFNQQDFSSRKGEIEDAMTGYRSLFGREVGADEWVLRLVRAHQQAFGNEGEKFYLYGHSAGGQYVGRFLVTHPDRVEKAVISAPATYPQPNPDVAWPFGLGELHAEIEWENNTKTRVDVLPDPQKWLEATQIPVTVIVGLNDTGAAPPRPGQRGRNRIALGRNWVNDMALFAQEHGLQSRFRFEVIPGKGHSMGGLLPYSQRALGSESE